ncbi:MAG: kinase [Omnitrophica WOR_2 bacterium SM23_29]|nr:MAG: kinase [Omnitrophica WOR_2 bacterium SM23_29]
MIISKTPFRVSFFGGGTDYPVWYRENTGAVLVTTIDKYCYITCRYLPPFFEHKHRIVYSKIENVKYTNEIQHPAVKSILEFCEIDKGIEIHHDGDLPARAGLGSSSSFTVGLLHSLYALKGYIISEDQLAKKAIYIERDILKENVGSQDQVAVSYGGFNKIIFNKDDEFRVDPVTIKKERIQQLQDHLMLIYTGFSRYASDIAKEQIKNTPNKKKELSIMQQMVDKAIGILNNDGDIIEFGKLLHEAWQVKKDLSDKISNSVVDEIYDRTLKAGAIGGKLLGAGGGGFMLLFASPERHQKIREVLKGILEVNFSFENEGSRIIYYSGQ